MPLDKPAKHVWDFVLALWLPIALLVVGYTFAKYYSEQQAQQNDQRINQAVAERIQQISQGVKEKVTLYQYGLRGTRGSVMSRTPQQFNYQAMMEYTRSRDYPLEFPGARGFGFIRYVQPQDKAAFLQRARQDRPGYDFTIRQITPHNDSLFVIQYIEPESDNKEAVGLDIGSDVLRREAALSAAFDNDVRLTAPITLVQAMNKVQHGFLILMPIYNIAPAPQTPQQRMNHLFGWSYAALLIDEVLVNIARLEQDVVLNISDLTPNQNTLFYQHGIEAEAKPQYQQDFTLALFGRQWLLQLAPTPQFIAAMELPAPRALFREIIIFSFLLSFIVYIVQLLFIRRQQIRKHKHELVEIAAATLKQANAKLEQQVEQRTAEIINTSALQRSILNGAGYAIIATDTDGVITVFNPAAEQLLGYRADEVVAHHTPALFHLPAEVEQRAHELTAELGTTVNVGFETFIVKAQFGKNDLRRWTYITKQGKPIPVKLNVSSLVDNNNRLLGYIGIAYDLTEQLHREAELAKAKELADSASKAKSDFLANMSHEIRTPMNAILGLLQLVEKTPLDKRQAEYINKTYRAAQSLLALLNDILDFSKVEAGKLELDEQPFNLTTLLQDIGIILSSSTQHKDIEVLYHIASDVPLNLYGDSLRIKQILLNLIGNAIKFTEHGEVVISISVIPAADDGIKLQFAVRDTGIGMTKEQQKHIFTGFHQAESSISRRFGGTGLGLAISKRLIDLMQGSISVSSNLGEGSTFSFEVALKKLSDQLIVPVQQATAFNFNVLVVDDNASSRLIMQEMCLAMGWQVSCVDNAELGLAMLMEAQDTPTPFTLVLLDWRLPEMDGLAFAEKVRCQPDIADATMIVMVTAHSKELLGTHPDISPELLDGFLVKPITADMLLKTLQQALSDSPSPAQAQPVVPSTMPLKGLCILLVEYNPTNQLVAIELLQSQGAEMTAADHGEHALNILAEPGSQFDVILMDIQMPQMDGYETTRHIRKREQYKYIPIIAMTANALPSDKAACIEAGMNDHIAKPFVLQEVIDKICHYCGQVSLATPQTYDLQVQHNTLLADFCDQQQIDVNPALQRLGGNLALYFKLAVQLQKDISTAIHQLSEQPTGKDLQLLSHSIKGAAATLGFTALANTAAKLEKTLSQGNADTSAQTSVLLKACYKAAEQLTALLQYQHFAPQHAMAQNSTSQPNASDNEQLQHDMLALLRHLNSANMAATAVFEHIRPDLSQLDTALTAAIGERISVLAFKEAAAILQTLIKQHE